MQVHFFAAARAAAGTAELSVAPSDIDSPTLGSLIAYLGRELTGTTPSGLTLAQVMEQCSFQRHPLRCRRATNRWRSS